VQSTIEAYLIMSGFSIGLSDLVADDETLSRMNDIEPVLRRQVSSRNRLGKGLRLVKQQTGRG